MEHSSSQSAVAIDAATGRRLGNFLGAVARWSVYLSVLLVPLFYLPFSVESLELPKQMLLIVLTAVGTLAWLGRMLVERKAQFRQSVIGLFLAVYGVIYVASAWFSKSRYVSFVGDFGQEKSGVVTLACFALMFFVGVNVLRGSKEAKNVMMWILAGGFLSTVQVYLHALGLRFLPGGAAQSDSFNLIGTPNAFGVYAGFMLVLLMGMFLTPEEGKGKFVKRVLMSVLAALSVLYVATQSFWVLWVVIIAGSATLVFYGMLRADKVKRITMLSLPMAAIVVGIVFSFVHFPISFGSPAEVMPSLKASWGIARQALAANPLLGSGPGTFLYDYGMFRSQDLNQTQFWNVHFDRSASRILTMLATEGILGLAAFMVLVCYLGFVAKFRLWRGSDDWAMTLTLFAGWVALLVGKFFYSSDLTLEFLFWTTTMLLVVMEWGQWREFTFDNSPRASLLLSFFLIVSVIFSIAGLYLEGQRYAGEVAYASALNRSPKTAVDVDASIEDLSRAVAMNANNDLYFRTLSQAYTLRTNLEVQKVGAKPNDEDSRRIALLAANAVNAGKRATELDPSNVQDWTSLANLYSQLVGSTQGADTAAEDAYQKAIALDPNNPTGYTSLGRVYLSLSDAASAGASQAKDDAGKQAAQKASTEALQKAKENFDKAITLKDDNADAQYWLAVAYQRMGKTKEAISKLEKTLSLNSGDLNVGFQLGLLYYQSGDKDKAIALLEKITQLSPSFSNAQWYLANMYKAAGRTDDAIARVQIVLKYNPGNADAQKYLDELKGGGGAGGSVLPAPQAAPSDAQVINTNPPTPAPAPAKKK